MHTRTAYVALLALTSSGSCAAHASNYRCTWARGEQGAGLAACTPDARGVGLRDCQQACSLFVCHSHHGRGQCRPLNASVSADVAIGALPAGMALRDCEASCGRKRATDSPGAQGKDHGKDRPRGAGKRRWTKASLGPRAAAAAARVLPPLREQAAERALWIEEREQIVLPRVLDEYGVEYWVLSQREYGEDIVWRSVASPTSFSARRRTVIVYRRTATGVERSDVVATPSTLFPGGPWNDPRYWARVRTALGVSGSIAINVDPTYAFSDGMHAGELQAFSAGVGELTMARTVNIAGVAVDFLQLRVPGMLVRYQDAMAIAHAIIEEAMSNAVIAPGVTTCSDVSWWMWEKAVSLGLGLSFQPSFGVQRRGADGTLDGDTVIERGDFLWCDYGLVVMNLYTDTQHVGYVLAEGEVAPPAGLQAGLLRSNAMQDILMAELTPGRSGNEVLANATARMEAAGIEGEFYSHPTGDHIHAAGALVGLWDLYNQPVPLKGDLAVRADTWWAIELCAYDNVPEWDGQRVVFRQEEDAAVYDGGNEWVLWRQEAMWLVQP